jgi:ribosomal protein L29
VETAKRELAELRVVKTLRRSRDNDGATDVIERELGRIETWAHEALLSAGSEATAVSEPALAA